jgi:hypothetical protein
VSRRAFEKAQREDDIYEARERLDKAARTVAAILDAGDRDPRWAESQELEAAAIELGRLLNKGER